MATIKANHILISLSFLAMTLSGISNPARHYIEDVKVLHLNQDSVQKTKQALTARLGKLVHSNDFEAAEALAERITKEFGSSLNRWDFYYSALIYTKLGEKKKAKRLLEKAVTAGISANQFIALKTDTLFDLLDISKQKAESLKTRIKENKFSLEDLDIPGIPLRRKTTRITHHLDGLSTNFTMYVNPENKAFALAVFVGDLNWLKSVPPLIVHFSPTFGAKNLIQSDYRIGDDPILSLADSLNGVVAIPIWNIEEDSTVTHKKAYQLVDDMITNLKQIQNTDKKDTHVTGVSAGAEAAISFAEQNKLESVFIISPLLKDSDELRKIKSLPIQFFFSSEDTFLDVPDTVNRIMSISPEAMVESDWLGGHSLLYTNSNFRQRLLTLMRDK